LYLNLNTCCPGSTCCTPTAIELSSFTAIPGNSQVTIKWETATEIDISGFNLYHSELEGGPYVQINGSIIPTEGSSTQGATYEFIDTNVQNGKTYYYKLEDIDQNGVSTMHGPVSATPSDNRPPDCSKAYADPGCLWPPFTQMVPVNILGVSDPDGDPVTITINTITSDEATATEKGAAGPKKAPDASGVGTSQAMLRAERSGRGDGRVYVISFTAADPAPFGFMCMGTVQVNVPLNPFSKDCPAVDSGQKYDATNIN
jgi:hypothetical protein